MKPHKTLQNQTMRLIHIGCFVAFLMSCDEGVNTVNNPSDAGDAAETSVDGDEERSDSPEIIELDISENRDVGLSAEITFSTSEPTIASVDVQGPDDQWTVGPTEQALRDHSFVVLGMTADTEYTFVIRAASDESEAISEPQSYRTDPLPDDFPPITVSHIDSDRMEPGLTLFNVYRWPSLTDPVWGYAIAVDGRGRVVWYYKETFLINDVKMMSNGNILYSALLNSAVEINTAGQEIHRIRTRDLGVDSIHHDVIEVTDGNLLLLSTEMRVIDGYPIGDDKTTAYNVIGDLIVEIDSDDNIVQTWNLFDYLDPMRVREGFHLRFWDPLYNLRGVKDPKDWSHANALVYDPRDDSILVSVCHQDWIIKLDRSTGDMLWTFGVDGDFTLEEGSWMYHQHAPQILENGNLLLYDNGFTRPSERSVDEPYSRVVEYALDTSDPSDLRARQVWEYGGESPYFCPFLGNANRLENGNTLITNGVFLTDLTLPLEDPANHKWAQIVEVTSGDSPEVVFDLEVNDPDMSYTIYRATRITGL